MPPNGLPKYRGQLGPAPWSQLELTEDLAASLKGAALRGCPSCGGKGHRPAAAGRVSPCHCVNRRDEARA